MLLYICSNQIILCQQINSHYYSRRVISTLRPLSQEVTHFLAKVAVWGTPYASPVTLQLLIIIWCNVYVSVYSKHLNICFHSIPHGIIWKHFVLKWQHKNTTQFKWWPVVCLWHFLPLLPQKWSNLDGSHENTATVCGAHRNRSLGRPEAWVGKKEGAVLQFHQ